MLSPIDSSRASLTVLLVEDDPADASLLTMRLSSSAVSLEAPDVRLLHADSAEAARAVLHDSAVDIVVLDLSLPDAPGLDALRRIRDAAPWVPAIVLTTSDRESQGLEALRAGAQDYVVKPPPDSRTFGRLLRNACERQRLLAQRDAAAHTSEQVARRWRLLAEVGKVLGAAGESAAAIDQVASLIVPDAADCFAVLLPGDDELPTTVSIRHVGGPSDELRSRVYRLVASGREDGEHPSAPLGATDLSRLDDAVRMVFATVGVVRGTVVPLQLGGRVRGLLLLASMAGRQDALTDLELGQSLAEQVASAMEKTCLLRRMTRAVAARDRAVSIVSHDLRNPLGTIQICATALLDPVPAPPEGIRHMAGLIQRSAAWMQQIIEDILDRASLDAGRLVLHRHPTAISDVIIAMQTLFGPVAELHAIEFVVPPASKLPDVDADRDRLLQALSNLVGNAMKFTPAGGRVALSARLAVTDPAALKAIDLGDGVTFAVSDTGPGIPPNELDHVFDWFWHAPRGGGSGGGTGLGLAIAKGLIEAHQSRLHVESTPGKGSTFWFTLPAAAAVPHEVGATTS